MNGQRRPSFLPKILGDVICDTLGADEDENLSVFRADLVEMTLQLASLLKVAADFHDLLDVMICRQFHGSDIDLDHVPKKILKRRRQYQRQPIMEHLRWRVSERPWAT